MKIYQKNILVNFLLSHNQRVDDDFSCNNKIFELIMSEKAFNAITEDQFSNSETVIQFLTRSMSCFYEENNKDFNESDKLNEMLEKKDYLIDSDLENHQIWSNVLEMISNFTKWLTNFAKKCPGFHEFDFDDLSLLVASAALFLYGIRFRRQIINNEFFIISGKSNILVSRKRMSSFSNETLNDLSFLFFKKLNELELTDFEIAVFFPVILLSCDANLVKDKNYLIDLRSCYVKTLLNQFRINKRDESFSRKLNTVSI